MLHSLDHAIVAVSDLASASADTEALLGRRAAWRGSHPGWGTANALFRLGNTYLELLAPAGDGMVGARVREVLAERGDGLLGLAFGTDDASACAAWLRERGLPALDPIDGAGRDAASGAERSWRNVLLPEEATRGPWIFAIEHVAGELPASPATHDERSVAAGLDHVVVHSPDLEASRALYGERLGLRLALDRPFEARGIRILFFRVGGVTVEVVGRLPQEAEAAPDAGAADRFGGLAWQVGDADAARARLEAQGFDVSEVRDGAKPGTRVFTVHDRTCGVPTLVIEPAPRLPRPGAGG